MSNISTSITHPLVSILINNYNYGRFLGQAIQSALDQTYSSVEIIVVDDGSTDCSREVMSSFGEKIKPIFKKNGGQASAYNAGLNVSTGQFVHFLDSDDILAPTAIEECLTVWQPGVAKVHFYLQVVEGPNASPTACLIPASRLANGDVTKQISSKGWYTSPPATGNFYSRHSLEPIFPMPECDWVTGADTFPIFLAPLFGEVRAIEKTLGYYRVHGANKDAQTQVNYKLLEYRLEKERHRDELFAEFCPLAGIPYSPGAVQKDIANMKLRFSALALDPSPTSENTPKMRDIASQMIPTCWSRKDWPITKKVAFTLWVTYLLVAPRRYIPTAIDLMFVPSRRSRLAQRLAHG